MCKNLKLYPDKNFIRMVNLPRSTYYQRTIDRGADALCRELDFMIHSKSPEELMKLRPDAIKEIKVHNEIKFVKVSGAKIINIDGKDIIEYPRPLEYMDKGYKVYSEIDGRKFTVESSMITYGRFLTNKNYVSITKVREY